MKPASAAVEPPGPASALWGVDFSSAPSRRKPIVVAHGELSGAVLRLQRLDALPTLADFEALLASLGKEAP